MEAADLAEEREELRLVALFVKLFLAEAGPPSEKSHEAGRRRVIVAGATTVRRPSEVYEDLERLLSSAQQGGYQARVSAATRAETEEEASEVHRSFETREIYVLVELPKRVKILGGLGSLFICPLLVLLIPLPYTWAMVKGDPLIITLLQMLPMVIPLWFLGFAMLMVAFKRISKMPIAKTVAKGLTLSTVAKTFLSELLAVVPGIGIMNLPNALPLLIVVIPVWLVIVAMTIDFNNNCEQLSTLTKSRTLKIVGELHVWGALLSIVLIGTVVLFIAYILQAAAFFSLPNALYIRSSETAHVSQPHGQKRKSLRNV
ncbi:MAG: DUF996 domain-containing protein [Candidatus Caldarchaeales archaeon]